MTKFKKAFGRNPYLVKDISLLLLYLLRNAMVEFLNKILIHIFKEHINLALTMLSKGMDPSILLPANHIVFTAYILYYFISM